VWGAELKLAERATSVRLARAFVRATLREWRSPVDHDDAVLVVSELVTNVLLHAHGTPMIRLLPVASGLRLEVCDDSPLPPLPARGLGLALVESLATDWGTSRRDRGKVVWCELPAAPGTSAGEATSA
jgi:anti-sigma regulatory factor (Ser/Thr protein kinase)